MINIGGRVSIIVIYKGPIRSRVRGNKVEREVVREIK